MANPAQPLTLRAAVGPAGSTKPLKDGTVVTPGIQFEFADVTSLIPAYRRMVRDQAYDVCELPIVTYQLARSWGRPLAALPIFLRHGFFHHWIVCRADSDIHQPRDLEQRRVAVRAYTVTPPTWVRGILRSAYGVDLDRVTWVTDDEDHVPEYQHPPNVVAAPAGATLAQLFKQGDLQAGFIGPAGIGTTDLPATRPLIAEPESAAFEWFRRSGVYPFQNVVVVPDTLLETHPWLAGALFDTFKRATATYLEQLDRDGPTTPDEAALLRRREVVGGDLLPGGLAANVRALQTIMEFAVDQRILTRTLDVAELFPPSTLDLA
jgi:4,5-dihydroxyphthalate decarboxylase